MLTLISALVVGLLVLAVVFARSTGTRIIAAVLAVLALNPTLAVLIAAVCVALYVIEGHREQVQR